MALQVQRTSLTKVRVITTLVALFALVVQPMYGLVAGQVANAAPDVTTVATGFGSLANWNVDRSPVSGTFVNASSGLTLGVVGASASSDAFYKTEGMSAALPANTSSIKASLFVDSAWQSITGVRAGIWGVSPGSYPIIEFSNRNEVNGQLSGVARFQVYDINTGSWIVLPTAVNYNSTYVFEMVQNATNGTLDYYINDELVSSLPSSDSVIKRVIFNNYNAGIVGNNYVVKWSNFSAGVRSTQAPTNLRFIKDTNSAVIPAGSFLNNSDVTLYWDTVSNAERYQVRVTSPSGVSQANRQLGWYTFDLNDAARHGFFGTEQGEWKYEVRTKDATTGVWSPYSTPLSINFDSTSPSSTVRANGISLPENNSVGPRVTIPGATPTTFQTAITEAGSGMNSTYIELFRADWLGNYTGGFITSNTEPVSIAAGSTQYGTSPKLVYSTSALSGKYGLKISTSDKAGNSKTTYHFFTVDSSLPAAQITSPADGAYLKGTVPVKITVGDNDLAAYSYRIMSLDTNVKPVDKVVNSTVGLTDSEVFSWDTTKSTDGKYYVYVSARDVAGNRSEQRIYVTVDNTAPRGVGATYTGGLKNVFSPQIVLGTTLGGAITFQVDIDEANPATMYAEVNWFNPATNKWEKRNGWGQMIASTTGTLSIDASAPSGRYQIKVSSIKDQAGNTATTQTFAFTVDNTKPTVSVSSSEGDAVAKFFREVSFKLHDTGSKIDRAELNGTPFASNRGSEWGDLNSVWANKGWSGAHEGVNTLSLYDIAGNVSTYSFTLDNSRPTVELIAPIGTIGGSSADVMGWVADSNMRYYACYITTNQPIHAFGKDFTAGQEPKSGLNNDQSLADPSCVTTFTSTSTGSVNSPGKLGSFNITGLPSGSYTIHVHGHDLAGNVTDSSTTFIIDHTAPVIAPGAYDPIMKTLTFTTPGADIVGNVMVSVGGSVSEPAVPNADRTVWIFDASTYNTPAKTYAYTATAFDAAGNEGTTDSVVGGVATPQTFMIAALPLAPATTPILPVDPVTGQPATIPVASLFRSGFNTVGASSFVADSAEVLGAQDTKGIDTGILGASKDIAAITPSAQGWKVFGIAWYWLLLAIAAITSISWWTAVARRREQEA